MDELWESQDFNHNHEWVEKSALDVANAEIERLKASHAKVVFLRIKGRLLAQGHKPENFIVLDALMNEFDAVCENEKLQEKLVTANSLLDECLAEVPEEGEQADCRFCNYDNYIYKKHDKGCLGVRIKQARGDG